MRVLSGVQPSGTLHVGNYFGAVRQFVRLQEENECFFFLADLHALTTVQDPVRLREMITDLATGYLALGLDPAKSVVYRQSDLPEVTELSWYLSTVTSMGLLQRCHSFKDKVAQGVVPSHGLFAYPVLMAADILIVKSDLVPVGKDQKQHLEVTRDVAASFHAVFGEEVFVLPKPLILEDVAVVPGVDGRKMSKSYDNAIEIFGPEKPIRKKIMGIVTDSTPVEEPKDTDQSVFQLWSLFASESEREAMWERAGEGGLGYGDVKKDLFERVMATFGPMRERRDALAAQPDLVEDVLRDGVKRARELAAPTFEAARAAAGVGSP